VLNIAILDANSTRKDADHFRSITSVVGQWLDWERQQAGIPSCEIRQCDILLLVHAGELDYKHSVEEALNLHGIEAQASRRTVPYIITGGAVVAAPLMALSIANAMAVGEAYTFVRNLFSMIKSDAHLEDIRAWLIDYPHAIERSQITDLEVNKEKPWLLTHPPQTLATPDTYIDWGDLPAFESDDGVVRPISSKGCHAKCLFCATTYLQRYQKHNNPSLLLDQFMQLKAQGKKVSLITNDAADLPFYDQVVDAGMLQFQSMTMFAVRNKHVRETLLSPKGHMKIVRFGIEGVSERIRKYIGKPISNQELSELLSELRQRNQMSHLFFIAGLPYEGGEDWQELHDFMFGENGLVETARKAVVRLKFTAYNPQPPTPLMYFVSGDIYHFHWTQFKSKLDAAYTRYLWDIPPRHPSNRARDLAETHHISYTQAKNIIPSAQTFDLAPSLNEAKHFPCEMIGWPTPLEVRYKMSRIYKRRMTNTEVL
jgi:hypothetical protein